MSGKCYALRVIDPKSTRLEWICRPDASTGLKITAIFDAALLVMGYRNAWREAQAWTAMLVCEVRPVPVGETGEPLEP